MKRGTIILTPFPFTDLTGNKVRPALIVSSNQQKRDDVNICFISSVIDTVNYQSTDIIIKRKSIEFILSGLKTESIIKVGKIATIVKSIILGELGYLSDEIMSVVDEKLKIVFDIQ